MINQPIIAVVTGLQGVATVKDSDGSVRALQVGDSIHLGETIQTGDGSFVTLQYDGQLTQTLGANASFLLDSHILDIVLSEEKGQIGSDTALALLSESVGPNPVPPIFIMPKDDGLHSFFAADYLAPESLVHSGYPTIGIASEKQHPLELYHNLVSHPSPEIVPAPIIVAVNNPPTITIDTGNPPTPGNPSGANDAVYEAGLSFGSTPTATTEFVAGSFRVSDPDGVSSIQSVTINGVFIPIGSLAGTVIPGSFGDLTVTSYDNTTGLATYSYQLLSHTTDVPNVDETDVFTLTTSDGSLTSAPAQIVIDIIDDVPKVTAEVIEPQTVYEDALTGGNGGAGETAASVTYTASDLAALVNIGADKPGTFSLNTAISGGTGLTQDSHTINWSYNVGTGEIEGVDASDFSVVFTVALNGSGDLVFTLKGHIDNGTGDEIIRL